MKKIVFLGVIAFLLSGCSMDIYEKHYFKSCSKTGDQPTNYFRLTVCGNAGLSKARYVSGVFDETAVDLFFSELKPTKKDEEQDPATPQVGEAVQRIAVKNNEGISMTPGPKNGALVMVLSTNADEVVDAIGQFANSAYVAQGITNLMNQDKIKAINAQTAEYPTQINRAISINADLKNLITVTLNGENQVVTEEVCLRILNAIANALGSPKEFTSIDQAVGYFRSQGQNLGG